MKNITKIGICMMMAFMLISVILPLNVYAEQNVKVTETFSSISELTAVANIEITGEDASDMRAGIDFASGDSDGEVTALEVDEFENEMEEMMAEDKSDYTLDGNRGTHTNLIYSVSGATGAVYSTDTMTIEAQTKIKFESINEALESHAFKIFTGEDGEEDSEEVDYELTVPGGYKIDTVKGLTGPVKSNSDRTVKGKANTETIEVTIVKTKGVSATGDSNDSPGFELLGAVVAIGLCVAILGWKKKK